MAIVMFLFGSALGLIGAVMQLALGFDAASALNTYALIAIGLPVVTLLAQQSRRRI